MKSLQKILQIIPTLLLSVLLAVIVWALAVTADDPTEEHAFPSTLPVQVAGLDDALMVVSMSPESVTVNLSAPASIWAQLRRDPSPINVEANLDGLDVGTHTVPAEVTVNLSPVRVTNVLPRNVTVRLDAYLERDMLITLDTIGIPSIGFEGEAARLDITSVLLSGPATEVEMVESVRAEINIQDLSQSLVTTLPLVPYDADGRVVRGITLSPTEVVVNQPIKQMGGYRNLVVKVVVEGQVEDGYRITNVSSFPAVVTVFSEQPELVDALPGFVDTEPLDISGANDDVDVYLRLVLPEGVNVVGATQVVLVQIGIAAIQDSMRIEGLAIELVGIPEGFRVAISPDTIDVIVSGPLPVLRRMTREDIRVFIDISDAVEGSYQRVPQIELYIMSVVVESSLPESVEVVIEVLDPEATPPADDNGIIWITATPNPTPVMTPTPTDDQNNGD
jgi:YbbR domain-containing protein